MTKKEKIKVAFWIIFGLNVMPLLILPLTKLESFVYSNLVTEITGENVYCFTARRNPQAGCYNVKERITWSTSYLPIKRPDGLVKNEEASKTLSKINRIPVYIILFLISGYFVHKLFNQKKDAKFIKK